MTSSSATETGPNQFIGSMALVVKDYDEAIEFFKNKLDFELICDETQSPKKRWVLLRPPSINPSPSTCCLLLAKADGCTQEAAIGNQTGGRVFMFLHTDDFQKDFKKYKDRGVKFIRDPVEQPYGTVAVFEDICGNKWDLVQMNSSGKHS